MSFALSHIEINVRDLTQMEAFYTNVLGLVVTDRGGDMVFLSGNAREHHQVVLSGGAPPEAKGSRDHVALRVDDLQGLRQFYSALQSYGGLAIDTVSHGNSWSVYFDDPEGNRLELFVDTPWYVKQPAYFKFDLSLSDTELVEWTRKEVESMAGTKSVEPWREGLRKRLSGGPV
ncbi:MAG: VOC family protein [Proteobacteria bacterium]|nr:VOC family protein [Pseudomonadota bacterium]MDA1059845.1 VOC family protein [Pseudomonadota bacterium]